MKKVLLLLLACLIFGFAFAQEAEPVFVSFKDSFDILASDNTKMDLVFHLPQFEIEEALVQNQVYHKVKIEGAPSLMKSGLPELPFVTTTVAIPYKGGVDVQVLDAQYSIIPSLNIYPVQQGEAFEAPKAFLKNDQFYGGNAVYPASVAEVTEPAIIRDFRIVTLQINPFSFSAATGELTVRENVSLRLSFNDEPSVNELDGPVQYVSPSFDKIYSSLIKNYDDYRSLLIANTPPRYLIIHGHTTDAQFNLYLNGFALWKRQKGADVDVFSTQQAGSSNTAIQTFIRNRYNNPATRPDYVILIGDTGGSYPIPCFQWQSYGATDYPYTHMNTGDALGDLFIGRISVENFSQFSACIEKIYFYEKHIPFQNVDIQWYNRMLLIGDWAPSGISTMYINKYIKEMALEYNPDYTFFEAYSDGTSEGFANTSITTGVAYYSFRGYIDFNPPSEGAINNGVKMPHAVVPTCGTGNFDSLAETEQMIRMGTAAAPKGCITASGMATSSTHTTFNNTVHGGVFAGIFAHGMRTMGEATMHGRLYLHDIFGVSSPGNVGNFSHWFNLMGDPTVEAWVGIPKQLQVTTSMLIPVGLSLLDVNVINEDDEAVEGASVVLSLAQNILSRGYTDAEGNVILVMPENMSSGNAVLTVTKHDCKTVQLNIFIDDSGTLVPDSFVINDSDEGGNDNGIATAGETVQLSFSLLNTGEDEITGISGTVVSNSPWVNIVNNAISYPDIAGEDVGTNTTPIIIEFDPATPPNTMVRIHLLLTDSLGNSYDISEFIPVEAVEIVFSDLSVVNTAHGVLNPDDEATVYVYLDNIAPVSVNGVHAKLYTENDLLSVVDGNFFVDIIPAAYGNSPGAVIAEFTVWQRPQTLPGMVMPLYIRFFNEDGFEQFVHFSLTVGQITSTDPLGPDSHGYVIYDWTDTSYPECPTYDWIELAPQLNGHGTALPISDNYNSGNEGDQVGSNALAVVNLPFTFQFYGRRYDQITVCSNGFIAMGVSANGEFRNFRLPGAMGPSPMIAPFWDDLATHSGSGIYTFYDRGQRAFIIEWYNMKNGKDGNTPETFQVILYDQSYYSTSLGDGPIKFQYHTFNNVDSQSGNRHGNYSTIGIQDHSGTVGLEYTFNNVYPTAAAPLSNGKALYITNVPTYYEEANLLVAETYFSVEDDMVGPGKEVEMGVLLQNSGNLGVQDVSATLSTNDPFVSIINATSTYNPLDVDETGVNKTPYRFYVDPATPGGHILNFTLSIVSGDFLWERPISVQVVAPKLSFDSMVIDDYATNYNGIIDIDEEVKLVIAVKNSSDVIARGITATLSSTQPNIFIEEPTIEDIEIKANSSKQLVFEAQFLGNADTNRELPMNLHLVYDNGDTEDITLSVPYGIEGAYHGFEITDGGFIPDSGWTWGEPTGVLPYGGNKCWITSLSGNYPDNVELYLYTPEYFLAENAELSFMHYFDMEEGYDGGNFSVSTDNGNTWTLLMPVGGYTHDSLAGLDLSAGYSGNSEDWQLATFNLSAYANQKVIFRFRMGSDGSNTARGWAIDDLRVNNIHQKASFIKGNVYLSSIMDPALATLKGSRNLTTNPDSNGAYKIYLPYGSHSLTATLPYHRSSSAHNLALTPETPYRNRDFTLIDMPAVSNFYASVVNEGTAFDMSWEPSPDALFNVENYRVYRKFDSGPFELVQEEIFPYYHEEFSLIGLYSYYVAPMYMGEEGLPTETITFFMDMVDSEDENAPALVTKLKGNYPNPFNPETTISFSLKESGNAELKVYNAKGQLVRTLAKGTMDAGEHRLVWDGRDDRGSSVASGIYFYRLMTKNYQETKKMILMK